MANDQELQINIEAEDNATKKLEGIEKSLASVRNAGEKMESVGKSMSLNVTAPIVAAGAAVSKFALDFNSKANEVASTANLTADQIREMKPAIEDVAIATGQATDGIFDAFQKAVSGSLNMEQSLELVRKSAKATAAGFGSTEELVNTSTTAFDNFGESAGSAADILDQLVGVSQNTQVQVQSMGNAFRRVSSSASAVGISLDESLSILSVVAERFGDTDRAGRAVAQMLQKLKVPTEQMRGEFKQLFGSTEEFQQLLQDDAIGALQELQERLKENNKSLGDVFRSSQTAAAAQQLLADGGERASEVLKQQSDSANSVSSAFDKSEGPARRLSRAMEQLKAAARPLGNEVLASLVPLVERLAGATSKLASVFSGLPSPVKQATVSIAGLAAVLGPVLFVVGKIITIGSSVISFFSSFAGIISTAATATGTAASAIAGAISLPAVAITAAVAAVIAGVITIVKNWQKVKSVTMSVFGAVSNFINDSFDKISKNITNKVNKITDTISTKFNRVKLFIVAFFDVLKNGADSAVFAFEFLLQEFGKVGQIAASIAIGLRKNFKKLLFAITKTVNTISNIVKTTFQSIKNSLIFLVSLAVGSVVVLFEKMGIDIISVITNFLNKAKNKIKNWKNSAISTFNLVKNGIKNIITDIKRTIEKELDIISIIFILQMNRIRNFLSIIWNSISNFVSRKINTIKKNISKGLNFVQSIWNTTWGVIKSLTNTALSAIRKFVKTGMTKVSSTVTNFVQPFKDAFSKVWEGVKNVTNSAWDGIKNSVTSGINFIINKLNSFIRKANEIAKKSSDVPGISASSIPQLGTIPKLADGGIVTEPTLSLIGEAGPEAVVPLNNNNTPAMGTINITVNGDVSGQELIDKVKQGIARDAAFNNAIA